MLSFQLYVERNNLGALNLYSSRPHAFTEEIGLLFASHAAVAYAAARTAANLNTALDTRGTIGQATGIIMERYHIGVDQAFAVLTRFSQHSNRKLRDVAIQVVQDTHDGHRSFTDLDPTAEP